MSLVKSFEAGRVPRLRIDHGPRLIARAAALVGLLAAAGCQDGSTSAYNDYSRSPSFLRDSYPDHVEAEARTLERSLIARGDSLYQRVIGRANCTMCHGPLLRGSTEGTNLLDDQWHNGDGSYASILSIIRNGVDKPDHMTMPPRGGMPLSDGDVEAIAAYVYWMTS